MKTQLFCTLLLIIGVKCFATPSVKTTTAKVSKATVYLQGAEITCSGDFALNPGLNYLVFNDVPANIDAGSLQATSKGNIVIMDVKFDRVPATSPKNSPVHAYSKKILELQDSVELINYEIDLINEQQANLTTEKNLLLNNRLIKGETKRDTLSLVIEGMGFLHQRLQNISNESAVLKKKMFLKKKEKTQLEAKINELSVLDENSNLPPERTMFCIKVLASSEIASNAQVAVTFFNSQANWVPAYDFKANSNGTVDLIQKAFLSQQSGLNWDDIDLTLSTSTPANKTELPFLSTYYLSVNKHRKETAVISAQNEGLKKIALSKTGSASEENDSREVPMDELSLSLADFTQMTQNMVQTEYKVKLKYAIPSDNDRHVVVVQSKNLKSDYEYSTIPKLDKAAYLIAGLYDWMDMNLIPGEARLYFDGSFLGKTVLDPAAQNDTLKLSLGKDKAILIDRKKQKDKSKEKIFLDEKVITIAYTITVKNTKSIATEISLKDQIPVSNVPGVVVELIDQDGANLNEENGELNWKLKLKPKETVKRTFSYQIKVPKNVTIAGL